MVIGFILLSSMAVAGVAVYAFQQVKRRREQRIRTNENKAAMTIRDYARAVKSHFEESKRKEVGTIEYQRIAVPTSSGYQLSIELSAQSFRIYGVPKAHNRTGRLSFYTDNSLIVKAADKSGDFASAQDDAFNRITADVFG